MSKNERYIQGLLNWIVFKSSFIKKGLLNFFGISIVPILYVIVCILGFWNPIENLGKATIAIMDQDKTVWLFRDKRTLTRDFEIGTLKDKDRNDISLELSEKEAKGSAAEN